MFVVRAGRPTFFLWLESKTCRGNGVKTWQVELIWTPLIVWWILNVMLVMTLVVLYGTKYLDLL